jgi:hypothetical protein
MSADRNPWCLYGDALLAKGWRVLPVRYGSKATYLNDWTGYVLDAHKLLRLKQGEPANIGLLTGAQRDGSFVIGVDMDVRHAEAAARIDNLAMKLLGLGPRRIGSAPKAMRLYRLAGGMKKRTSAGFRFPEDVDATTPQQVEILADGQQGVIYGRHPIGSDYQWPDGAAPRGMCPRDLPLVTFDALDGFMRGAEDILRACGGVQVIRGGGGGRPEQQRQLPRERYLAPDPAFCLMQLRTLSVDDWHYDNWIALGFAIKGALGDTAEARDMWLDLTTASNKFNAANDGSRAWDSFDEKKIRSGYEAISRLIPAAWWFRPHSDWLDDLEDMLRTGLPVPDALLSLFVGAEHAAALVAALEYAAMFAAPGIAVDTAGVLARVEDMRARIQVAVRDTEPLMPDAYLADALAAAAAKAPLLDGTLEEAEQFMREFAARVDALCGPIQRRPLALTRRRFGTAR